MTYRAYNFSAGPAALPTEVLEIMKDELMDFRGLGSSVMEISHRSTTFMAVYHHAIDTLKSLLNIPDHYRVLFMQGGALGQNALLAMNLLGQGQRTNVDHVISGAWSLKTYHEVKRYSQSQIVANSDDGQGRYLYYPEPDAWQLSSKPAFVNICTNETMHGVEWFAPQSLSDQLAREESFLVADMSSHILSRPIDVTQYGVIFGGAQKNIGPAGLTFVIVREDLLDRQHDLCPSAFNWRTVADNDSMFNTPPTLAIYLAGLVFEWIKNQGGLDAMAKVNDAKAKLLYQTIDESALYRNDIQKNYRSCMNVPFFLENESLNAKFLEQSTKEGLTSLKGHKMVGGMRASIYNAMPLEGVEALTQFMAEFERTNG